MARPANKTKIETASPAVKIWGNVLSAMYITGKTKKDVAAAMGMSEQTYNARQAHPETVTLGELQHLSVLLGLPFEKLVCTGEK